MSKKLKAISSILSISIFFLALTAAASVSAQTTPCSKLTTATGQPGWLLESGPGINAPKSPIIVSPYPGWQSPALAGSSWVSPDSNYGSAAGDYVYEFAFCLCKQGKQALGLSFYADNGAKVFLNNTQIFATSGSTNFYGVAKSVNYSWVGSPGPNKLRIVVRNNEGPTGLSAVLSINGATAGSCCRSTATRDWRLEISEKINAEAARLGLRLEGDYSFQSDGSVLMVSAQVLNGDGGPKSNLIKGRARLAYLEGHEASGLPPGFYLINISPQLAKMMDARFGGNSGVLTDQNVTFVSTDGRITKDVPVVAIYYRDPLTQFRHHYWTRIETGSAFDPHGGGFWIDGGP